MDHIGPVTGSLYFYFTKDKGRRRRWKQQFSQKPWYRVAIRMVRRNSDMSFGLVNCTRLYKGVQFKIQTPTRWNLICRSMSNPLSLLSPNSILPPTSCHCADIPAMKNLARFSKLLLLSSSSLSSPLCRVFILIFLRQTMSLGNTVLQLFSCYYSWCLYH